MTNIKLNEYLHLHPDNKSQYFGEFSMVELNAFYGLITLSGVFHSNKESISELFSEDVNKAKPIFKSTMARERQSFFQIFAF